MHMDIVIEKGEQASDEEKRRVFQKLNAKLEKIKEKLEDDDLMKVLEFLPWKSKYLSYARSARCQLKITQEH